MKTQAEIREAVHRMGKDELRNNLLSALDWILVLKARIHELEKEPEVAGGE